MSLDNNPFAALSLDETSIFVPASFSTPHAIKSPRRKAHYAPTWLDLSLAPPPPFHPSFVILSFNVLAEVYGKPAYFDYVDPEHLSWKYRRERLLSIIIMSKADIICLQEVDHFDDFFRQALNERGYQAAFGKRGGAKRDGCATFWKKDRFVKQSKEVLDYDLLVCEEDVAALSADPTVFFQARHAKTRNAALIVTLLDLKAEAMGYPPVIIANTHLYWQDMFVKLLQTRYLIKNLERIVSDGSGGAVIMVGDYNAHKYSDVVHFVTNGSIPNERKGEVFGLSGFEHDFGFASAYAKINHPDTNITPTFSECLDYIFMQSKYFVPTAITLTHDGDGNNAYLPNAFHASDHVPVMAKIKYRTQEGD